MTENLNIDTWPQKVLNDFQPKDQEIIKQAISLAKIANENNPEIIKESIATADTLHKLHLDSTTIAAAILYNTIKRSELSIEDVEEHLGEQVRKLIQSVEQMSGISEFYHGISDDSKYSHNITNIRKMFLAMVDDIRVILIKLSEHLAILRNAKNLPKQIKMKLAHETMAIYAPLTNRLGIAQIKWELEDLAFQYLEDKKYKEIKRSLEKHFPESAKYIDEVSEELKKVLSEAKIKDHRISGRTKHIYSIHRKMNRKKIGLEGIYDVSAMRIFVPTISECYKALSSIHTAWKYISHEFDDYIAAPKPNGYKSIHTAVFGPKDRVVEIQIRTYDMHREAELGVAAHWVYKEGKQEANYQAKLSWLRQVMDWQQEVTKTEKNLVNLQQIFNEHIYVFTPNGDILELPKDSTPLDFAYFVHSELGHRCVGAKINNKLVTLTYTLQTGDRIEILTSRNSKPSRDWLVSRLGFLKTIRARSKVLHWFKKQSKDHNITQGHDLLDKEIKRLHLDKIDIKKATNKLNFKTSDDLFAALGSGDLKFSSILNALEIEVGKPSTETTKELIPDKPLKQIYTSDINIQGVKNLLIHTANCCKPIPGEEIIGYITIGRGIAVHRTDCINVLHSSKLYPERFVLASWGENTKQRYPVNIEVRAFDREDLVRDIKNILAEEEITLVKLDIVNKKSNMIKIKITIEILSANLLSQILNKIGRIPNIIEIYRSD